MVSSVQNQNLSMQFDQAITRQQLEGDGSPQVKETTETEQIELQQQQQQDLSTKVAEAEAEWDKVHAAIEGQHVQFDFDPKQQADFQLPFDEQGRLRQNDEEPFFVPASLLTAKTELVHGVRELMVDALSETRSAEYAPREAAHPAWAPWKQAVVAEAIEMNAAVIRELKAARLPTDRDVLRAAGSASPAKQFDSRAMQLSDPRLATLHQFDKPGPSSTRPHSSKPIQATLPPHNASNPIRESACLLRLGLSQAVAARLATFMANAALKGFSLDVHGFLQHVLRMAYIEGMKDLMYRRDRVHAHNQAKKILRDYICDQRSLLTEARVAGMRALQAELDRRAAARANHKVEKGEEWERKFSAAKQRYEQYRAAQASKESSSSSSSRSSRSSNSSSSSSNSTNAPPGPPRYGLKTKSDYVKTAMDDYDKANPPMTSNQQEDFADRVSDEYIDFVAESVSTDTNPPSMVATNKRITCREELETFIKNKEADLASIGDDAQMANVDLQNTLQKQQQIMTTMTNISKLLHDTALAVIRKIG